MFRARNLAPSVLPLILAALVLSGCAGVQTPVHPGAINQFDSGAYDTLIMLQASLTRCTQELAIHPEYGKYKDELNLAIQAYNTAQAAYKTYHTAGTAPAPTAAQTAALQAQIADVVTQVAKLLTALGVKP